MVRTSARQKRKRVESADLDIKSPSRSRPQKVRNKNISKNVPQKTVQPASEAVQTESSCMEASDFKLDTSIEKLIESLKCKLKKVTLTGFKPVAPHSDSIVHCLQELQLGRSIRHNHHRSVRQTVVEDVSEMQLFRTASPFNRRCTALEWHPTNPNVVVVGSKGGDIMVWNINEVGTEMIVEGIGPGGSIQALMFQPQDGNYMMTASVDGTVTTHNLQTKHAHIFLDTMNSPQNWFCSLDVSQKTGVVVAGDNFGNVILKTVKGEKVMQQRLHRTKVTHIEYSPREDWLLASASVDNTVRLWDLRMMDGRDSALAVLKHDKPVNSAYFSLTTGTRLLTTDQHSQLRVYAAPTFDLTTNIPHPHRQFQHMTPIKAFWHPLQDLVVVGRYPDVNFPGSSKDEPRTIDVFDGTSGKMACQLLDPMAKGIVSLNKFSHNGDYLASTMGTNTLIWSRRHGMEEEQAALKDAMERMTRHRADTGGTNRPGAGADRPRNKRKPSESKPTQSKLKGKDNMKTKKK